MPLTQKWPVFYVISKKTVLAGLLKYAADVHRYPPHLNFASDMMMKDVVGIC